MQRIVQHVAFSCLALVIAANAIAADTPVTTVMTVGGMCGGCVKAITSKLETVDGVEKVSCDIKLKTVTFTHTAGKTLSARTLWGAMEEIGRTPKKLVGPEGTYESKPKS